MLFVADPIVGPKYIKYVRKFGYLLTGGNLKLLSKQRIRRLANIMCKHYGERWLQTYNKVNLLPEASKNLPSEGILWLRTMFARYRAVLMLMRQEGKLPKKFIKYNYTYRQFLRLHDHLFGTKWHQRHGWWFNIPGTAEKIRQYDEEYQQVLARLNEGLAKNKQLPFLPMASNFLDGQ